MLCKRRPHELEASDGPTWPLRTMNSTEDRRTSSILLGTETAPTVVLQHWYGSYRLAGRAHHEWRHHAAASDEGFATGSTCGIIPHNAVH